MTGDGKDVIDDYLTDMLALEEHIGKAVKGQLRDLKDYPDVIAALRPTHTTIEHHISDLRMVADRRSAGRAAGSVKPAGAAAVGAAVGLSDLVRGQGLPKNLRDDHTAFNLANIGYVMLRTTALALGDHGVADLAHQHFRDYTDAVMRLNNIIPAAVVTYLEHQGLPVRTDIVSEVNESFARAWGQGSDWPAG